MARFFSLIPRTAGFMAVAGWLGCCSTSSRAETPVAPAPPAPIKSAPVKPAPVKTTATNAPSATPPQDTLTRYGNILVPGDEANHPLRLKLPFPGVGEVKIPNQGDVTMREKLEKLATLSDDEIHGQLEKWPVFAKMSLRDQASMLGRIQDFRDYRTKVAMQKAHDMGLLTLTDEQKKKFEMDYWDKRLQMDHDLAKQFEPIYREREEKFKDELYREYSAISGVPVAQGPKPPEPPAAPGVPASKIAPAPAAKTAATNAPAPGTAPEPMMMQQQ